MADEKWIERAALYEMLSMAFSLPTDILTKALAEGEYAEALIEITGLLDLQTPEVNAAIEELAPYKKRKPKDILHELRVEYTRLFVGAPTPVVSPYAGVWQAERDGVEPLLFVSKEAMAVERFMRSCGVGRPEGTNEPLDSMGTELEFLQYLALSRAGVTTPPESVSIPDGAFEEFYSEHFLIWSSDFAHKVIENTKVPFFKVVAEILSFC
jgi:TorA maturation chaperone TorD